MGNSIRSIEDAAAQSIPILGPLLAVDTICITLQESSGHRVIGAFNRGDKLLDTGETVPLPPLTPPAPDAQSSAVSFIAITNISEDERTAGTPLAHRLGSCSLLLAAAGKPQNTGPVPAICLLDRSPIELSQTQLESLHAMTALLGYVSELENASLTDSLTGLYNRRYLNHLSRSGADKHYSVLFIDIDDFKEVNDRFGHDIGDAALQQIADRLRQNVRKSDVLIRYGGDEFIILFRHLADNGDMQFVADKIKHSLSQPYTIGNRSIRIGASLGVSGDGGRDRSLPQLITDADKAMYSMKQHDNANPGLN